MTTREILEKLIKDNKEIIGVLSINPSEVSLKATHQLRDCNSTISLLISMLERMEASVLSISVPTEIPKVPEGYSELEKKYG